MRAHPKGKTLVRKAGRPGSRKALQAPGKRRAQEQVKNVGREYKTSAFLNTYQKPYEVALTHKDMDALKPTNGSRMLTKNIKLPSAPNFPRPFTHQLTRFLHSCNRSLKIPINTFSICRNCRDGTEVPVSVWSSRRRTFASPGGLSAGNGRGALSRTDLPAGRKTLCSGRH